MANSLEYAQRFGKHIKTMFNIRSLRIKLSLYILLITLCSICLMASVIIMTFSRYAHKKLEEHSLEYLKTVSYILNTAMEFDDKELVKNFLDLLKNTKEFVDVKILTQNGKIYLQKHLTDTSNIKHNNIFNIEVPITNDFKEPLGTVQVSVSKFFLEKEIRKNIINIITLTTITLIILMCCVLYIVGKFLKPLSNLKTSINMIASGGFVGKLDTSSNDEISEVAVAFNKMNKQLHQTMVSRDELAKEIEERKRTNTELARTENKYRIIAEQSGQVVYDYDINSDQIQWSGLTEQIIGYTINEFQNVTIDMWKQLIHPNDRKRAEELLQKCMTSGESFDCEYRLKTKSGKYIIVENNGVFLRDKTEHIYRMLGTIKNITERKQAENEIKKFKIIADNANYGVFITDIKGTILYINEYYTKMYGYETTDLLRKNFDILYDTRQKFNMHNEYENLITTGNLSGRDVIGITKDGSKIPMLWNAVVIKDDNDKPVFIANTSIDITEKQKIEEQLRQAKEIAEAANEAKSRFLANVSHEIRTPMNAIIGFVELLKATPVTDQQLDYLETIAMSGTTLLDIINEVLDISKIEAGEISLEYIDFNIHYLIEDIFKLIRPRITNKDIELKYLIEDNVPPNIHSDPTRLRQVMINLFNNAIKFTASGEVGLHIQVEKSLSDKIFILKFTVHDTGIGIAPSKTKEIFEPFAQADMSTTRKYGGTGLGLPIARNFVELMGGQMWVESEEGNGSRFIFTIKCEERPPIATQQIFPLKEEELATKRVLIVDDNRNNRRIITSICEEINMLVTQSDSLKQAMEYLTITCTKKTMYPDVILMDIMMPDHDGYELAQSIRANKDFDKIKLIAITSDLKIGASNKAKHCNFDGYLTKPIFRRELLKVMNTVLGDKRKEGQIITHHMAEEYACKGLRILVAEDNKTNQKLIKLILANLGCIVTIVNNGLEALENLHHNEYDVVLMDIQMPVMSGYEATKKIREEFEDNINIIALTADALKEDEDKCMASGMNDYLRKPIDALKLKEKLVKWGKNTS